MGGYGSGRWGDARTKQETDAAIALDVRRLHRAGCLSPPGQARSQTLHWDRDGVITHRVVIFHDGDDDLVRIRGGGSAVETVVIERTPCHFGGSRPWFRCPGCDARVAMLYAPAHQFRCRACHGLAYGSTREAPTDRLLRRAERIRDRLGGSGGLFDGVPRPARMHRRTYDRLMAELHDCEVDAMWLLLGS